MQLTLKTDYIISNFQIGCRYMIAKKLIFTVFLVLLVSPLPSHAQLALRIAFPSFPPFHWIDEHGIKKGFFYEIMHEALDKRMGIATVWTVYPWPRCQDNLKAGKDDAVITVPTVERSDYTLTHKRPFYQKPLNVFTSVDHPRLIEIKNISTIADIKKKGFSTITYIGNGWHKEHVQPLGIKTYESPFLKNIWKMLAVHRGDIVIEWPSGAWPDILKLGLKDRILDTGTTVASMPFHLLIRKRSPYVTILDEFDVTISKMYADGTIQLILERYDH